MNRLDEIKARVDEATLGPWENADPQCIRHAEPNIYAGSEEIADVYAVTDSEFIAHARQDVPWLLDEIARLKQVLKDQRELWELAKPTLDLADARAHKVKFMELHDPIGAIDAVS